MSACNAADPGSIPGLGGSPGEGNGNPLKYSCLENPRDRGACWATVHGVAKSQTRLSDFTYLQESAFIVNPLKWSLFYLFYTQIESIQLCYKDSHVPIVQ